jgi:hypothetical protein
MDDHDLHKWEDEGGAVSKEQLLETAKDLGHAIMDGAKKLGSAIAGVVREIVADEEPAIKAAEDALKNEAVIEGRAALRAGAQLGAAELEAEVPLAAPIVAAGEKAFEAELDKS